MNILDKRFKYVPAASSDIRKTFARVKRELREADRQNAANMAEAAEKVVKPHFKMKVGE